MVNITETREFRENRQFVRDMIPIIRGSVARGGITCEEAVAEARGLRKQFRFNRSGGVERVRPETPLVPSLETIRAYEARQQREAWERVHQQIARRRRNGWF